MNGQDVLALVPGRPLHDELALSAEERRERINLSMAFGLNRAPRVVPEVPAFPLGYGERDALV